MYYHCSPVSGLTLLQPQKPQHFDKDALVYMTTSLPMALMYGIRNFEYTYGYTKDGQIYYEEYFPDALRILYEGKSASLYECAPPETEQTQIPNEVVSRLPVRICREIPIPDVMQALLEQEQMGALEAELRADVRLWADQKRQIGETIESVDKPVHRQLLEYRYLCGWDWRKIAGRMHYSIDRVWHIHSEALREIRVPEPPRC